ncbi:tyrosine-type recombinase/integrase [Streptomyces sp. So13.3]|uniref:tyrosine-type recombinase/integrase n=1 Tax=Streptomyces sp. So13.3 TaxID=2136173 RepID=UPI001FD4C5F7|nr:tyrosine-type recombinase/integrase [Streptomyces sp. So13.3]
MFQKCKVDKRSKCYPCVRSRCGHSWTVRYREPGGRSGRQREVSFRRKALADGFAARVESDKVLGIYIGVTGWKKPLAEVYREFIDCGDRARTTRCQYEASLRCHIEPYFRGRPIGSVKAKDVRAWLVWMVEERGYARSTAYSRYGILRGVFGFAVANDYLAKDPCRQVRWGSRYGRRGVRRVIRLPSLSEIAAIAEHLPGPYRLVVWLMAGCGLRIGEASAVSLGQFDFADGTLRVDRQITQDGGQHLPGVRGRRVLPKRRGRAHRIRHLKGREQDEGRLVPVPLSIAAKVREHVRCYGTFRVEDGPNRLVGDYLFANLGRTNILMYSLISRLWHAARCAAGIVREITPHWLRHFFASAGLAKGVPVTDMAEWLGHRDSRTTHRTYAHVMPDAPERLRTVMDSIFTLEAEVNLPLEFEAVHEAAFAVKY